MSSGDAPKKSERDDSITAPSLLDEAEPSLSTLGRLEGASSAAASASRERPAEWGADHVWGAIAASTDDGQGREGSGATQPSVCPTFVFARAALVSQRYVIRRFIGRGGMGQVYEAYDRVLREPVALKTTTGQTGSDAHRLLEEVRMARRITHPNVCRLYDAGVHEERDGAQRTAYFLTMEYLEGHTLRRRLRHGLPPLQQVFGIGRQLLIGLAAVHAAGVLHRDFKSENVMLRLPGNGTGQAVIMDFGLARPLRTEEVAPGGPGAGAGSRGYMAPEQIENLPLGPETDLFAFGVVMFEMLTGRLPFESGPSTATVVPLFDQTPMAPSQLRSDLPPELDAFVLKCLNAQRQNRYRSAERALAALQRVFEHSARSPSAATTWPAGYGFPRRNARFMRQPHR